MSTVFRGAVFGFVAFVIIVFIDSAAGAEKLYFVRDSRSSPKKVEEVKKFVVWIELPPSILNNNLLYIITIREKSTQKIVLDWYVSRYNTIRIRTLPGAGKDIKLPLGEYECMIEITPLTALDEQSIIYWKSLQIPGRKSVEVKYPVMTRNIIYRSKYRSITVKEPTGYIYGMSQVYAILRVNDG